MMAVNILMRTPRPRTSAKPLIGPVPKFHRIAHVINVHTLESKIEVKALANPVSIAARRVLPLRNSSFNRSNMRMLASTAIPMDTMYAAMPGSVSVTPSSLNTASVKTA